MHAGLCDAAALLLAKRYVASQFDYDECVTEGRRS